MADQQNESKAIAFLFVTALLAPLGAAGAFKPSFITGHPLASVGIGVGWLAVLAVGSIVLGLFDKWRGAIIDWLSDLLLRKNARLERRYLNRVRDELRWAEGGGVSSGTSRRQGETPRLALDMVFVDSGLNSGTTGPGEGLLPHIADEDSGESSSLISLVNREDNPPSILVVKGVPGSGKTTLLRHAALHACDRDWFRWRHRGPGRRIPILLYLREHGDDIAANPDKSLIELLAGPRFQISGGPQPGWFRKKFEQGECLVLLDGLDEISQEEDRRLIAGWAKQQCDVHQKNRFVLSSRPSGYQSGSIPGAEVVSVQGFDRDQIKAYIGRWYREVEKNASWAAREKTVGGAPGQEAADQKSNDLWRQLETADDLMGLAANPLLLTLIATVHRGGETLPHRRTDIYLEICEAVLWRRARAKGVPSKLEGRQKQAILTELAYEMMSRSSVVLSGAEAADIISGPLASMTSDPELTAAAFLADVSFDGLLIMPTADSYAFTHKTFQEYLAAVHIEDRGKADVLPDKVDNPWWEETIVFYASIADASPAVRACLDRDTFKTLEVARRCGDVFHELMPEVRDRLDAFRPALSSGDLKGKTSDELRELARLLLERYLGSPRSAGEDTVPRPVPVGIYRVFLADKKPFPDAPPVSRREADDATVGMRASDARAFIEWINENRPGGSPVYRLAAAAPGPSAATDATAENPARVSAMPPADHGIITALRLVLLLNRMQARLDAVPPIPARNRILSRFSAKVTRRAIDLDLALALVRDLARDLVRVRDLAIVLDLVRVRVRDLDLVRDLVRDLAIVLDLDRVSDLDRVRALVRDLARDLDLDRVSARDLDLALGVSGAKDSGFMSHAREYDFNFAGIEGWGRGDVGTVVSRTISRFSGDFLSKDLSMEGFMSAFGVAVGVLEERPVPDMDALPGTLDDACEVLLEASGAQGDPEFPGDWARGMIERLADRARPVLAREERVTPREASAIRMACLCLAGEADALGRSDIGDRFRDIAAGVTWLEGRQHGDIPATETIMVTAT